MKNRVTIAYAIFGLLLLTAAWAYSQQPQVGGTAVDALIPSPPEQPVEVGLVRWQRDLDAALQASQRSGKPVLVLFQEVPGCAGCKKFGRDVLSHPLIVDAIENEFSPVVVYNNRSSGTDAALLRRFKEPAWNYQVIRFLDGAGDDIIPRKDRVWSVPALADRMVRTLKAAKKPVPKYLSSLLSSTSSANQQKVAFAMSCFWTGEFKLGVIDGVTATEAGWLDGREVTLVRYDQSQISLADLAKEAEKVRCAQKIYTPDGRRFGRLAAGKLDASYRVASASDQKRQLSRWPRLRQIPGVNDVQLTKLNSLMSVDQDVAFEWLSPRQRSWLTTGS